MKTASRFLGLFVAVIALVAVTGCRTVSVSYIQYVGGPIYAPVAPAQIQILRAAPTRPNIRLGEVRAEPSNDSVSVQQIEAKLRQAAGKMGADAVVIVSDRNQVTGTYITGPWYGRSIQQTTARVVIGVAIKYTGN